ncbi:MAG: epoxyqueuosine reductase QueH [Candidatus Hydrothermarchaeales archaeon]
MISRPRLLLHICCAPCSTHVIDTLKENYDITCFFYNPNIQPKEEYILRSGEMEGLAQKMGVATLEGDYDVGEWFKAIKGLEDEPEGGKRCEICFRIRLEKTAEFAMDHGFQCFTTTLTIGPQKDAKLINSIGDELSRRYNVEFHQANFKKKDGFKKSVELSKRYGLLRQNYCGCIFSKREREAESISASDV